MSRMGLQERKEEEIGREGEKREPSEGGMDAPDPVFETWLCSWFKQCVLRSVESL